MPAYEFHILHREGLRHRCAGCMFHNAILANPGRYRISHNARCRCHRQPHPNKTSTNISRRILNSCNHPVDSLTELFRSRMAVRIFHPTHQVQDLCIHQYFESCRQKAPQHQPRLEGSINRSTRMIRHSAHYYEDKHSALYCILLYIYNERPFPILTPLNYICLFVYAINLWSGR